MMPLSDNANPRIWQLANSVCEGTITEQEFYELEELLESDREAKEFYIDYLNLNAELSWMMGCKCQGEELFACSQNKTLDNEKLPPSGFLDLFAGFTDYFQQHSPYSYMLLSLFVGIILITSAYVINTPNSSIIPIKNDYVARITVTKDCQWSSDATPVEESSQLRIDQKIELEQGLLEITYSNKAKVLIEGPASFAIDSKKSGFLSKGKLLARADTEKSRQFTITTPNAKFVDLGTEFGVEVDVKGKSSVAVFSGKVNAAAKLDEGRWTNPIPVKEDEAVVCEGQKFAPLVAQRSNFPSLNPLPPPSPKVNFQRWSDTSKALQADSDLVAYYDFQKDEKNLNVLVNRAATGQMFNGQIQKANWCQGRFPGKDALEFMSQDSGVHIDIPVECKQMTLIAWVSKKQFNKRYSSILMSDGWGKNKLLHWELLDKGSIDLCVFGQFDTGITKKQISIDDLNQWVMLAGTIDSKTKATQYLNGELFEHLNSREIPPILIGSAVIGGWKYSNKDDSDSGGPRHFSGLIDELIIFKRVLTAGEIKQIYESGKP